jgi:hypothetical protein
MNVSELRIKGHRFCAGLLLLRRYGRRRCLAGVTTGTDNIIVSLASKRGCSTGGLVIERKTLKVIL